MNNIGHIVVRTLVAATAIGYIVVALHYGHKVGAGAVCKTVNIQIADSTRRQFISSNEVNFLLHQKGVYPVGKTLDEVSCGEIEQAINQHPVVREAQCYENTDQEVCIRIQQREPELRIISSENYFVDTERQIMPVGKTTASYVPVATGNISRDYATTELAEFAEWLMDNDFWNAQIEQVYVKDTNHVELVPRVGSGVIVLGNLNGYEGKLKKLKTLYTKGFAKIGWKNYKEIDLRYKGQVVCR